jgi:hypothetical protein
MDARNDRGCTPLHAAAHGAQADCVRVLCKLGRERRGKERGWMKEERGERRGGGGGEKKKL